MRAFKTLYNAISILLMTVQIGFLAILIYNKITIGRITMAIMMSQTLDLKNILKYSRHFYIAL